MNYDNKPSATKSIREFMERDGGKPITFDELKALSPQERDELGTMSRQALR